MGKSGRKIKLIEFNFEQKLPNTELHSLILFSYSHYQQTKTKLTSSSFATKYNVNCITQFRFNDLFSLYDFRGHYFSRTFNFAIFL